MTGVSRMGSRGGSEPDLPTSRSVDHFALMNAATDYMDNQMAAVKEEVEEPEDIENFFEKNMKSIQEGQYEAIPKRSARPSFNNDIGGF